MTGKRKAASPSGRMTDLDHRIVMSADEDFVIRIDLVSGRVTEASGSLDSLKGMAYRLRRAGKVRAFAISTSGGKEVVSYTRM
jgi:hypothetical protein